MRGFTLFVMMITLALVPACTSRDREDTGSQPPTSADGTSPASPGKAETRAEGGDMAEPSSADGENQELANEAREALASEQMFPFDFTVTDLDGNEIKLADLRGKLVIVDFWGTWCPPCRAEIPSFIQLQEKYGPQGLQIIGLTYERSGSADENAKIVRTFVEENGVNYPCALGTDAITDQVPDFRAFPTTLFVDRSGDVRAKLVGLHEYEFLEALTRLLLDDSTAAAESS